MVDKSKVAKYILGALAGISLFYNAYQVYDKAKTTWDVREFKKNYPKIEYKMKPELIRKDLIHKEMVIFSQIDSDLKELKSQIDSGLTIDPDNMKGIILGINKKLNEIKIFDVRSLQTTILDIAEANKKAYKEKASKWE